MIRMLLPLRLHLWPVLLPWCRLQPSQSSGFLKYQALSPQNSQSFFLLPLPSALANASCRSKIREHFLWGRFLNLPAWARFTSFAILQHPILLQKQPLFSCAGYSLMSPPLTCKLPRERTMLTCPSLCPSTQHVTEDTTDTQSPSSWSHSSILLPLEHSYLSQIILFINMITGL